MDQSLRTLCDALKKTIRQLKPQHQAVSFFLLTGKTRQGKTTLLRQSHYEHIIVHAERGADIYYNQHSVILELCESWLTQSKNLLQYTLKHLNRCHRTVKITGIILCVDINDLFLAEPIQYKTQSKTHAQFLERFGQSLGYRVDTAIMFTKLDALAGFCDFFQHDHATELNKPLGFSLDDASKPGKLLDHYQTQFDHFIEVLGQQVINKIHPARSSIKRTLIREFPLQLAYLRAAIQSLVQNISPRRFHLSALYFTSAEQGTASLDRLNKKIQHEYGLTVQDQFPQSTNYQAYFIEGALSAFHTQTKRHAPRITRMHQWGMGGLAGIAGLALIWMAHQYLNSAQRLDEASKELLAYDILASQHNKQTAALYHLAKASSQLAEIASNTFSSQSVIQQLKTQLQTNTSQHLNDRFIPHLLADLEQVISDNHQTQRARYDALKIYLMFETPERFSSSEIESWFHAHWNAANPHRALKNSTLLAQALHQPKRVIPINQHIVRDARNDLNALPATYLYYSLAKKSFTKETLPLNVEGFSLASKDVPVYLTKAGFQPLLLSLPAIAAQLQNDNWVLARQDIGDLAALLQQAYCYEYVVWWQKFMRHTRPLHVEDYRQARELTQALHKSDGIAKLLLLIQQQLSPEPGPNATLFNQEIASKFTELSLISHSAVLHLSETLDELDRFLSTLSIVDDHGKTAFTLTKGRFQGDTLNNPLSSLYGYAHQLPAPVSEWAKNIADDSWFTLINDSRTYINQQWQQTVLHDYQTLIAQRYPFDNAGTQEIALADFDRFFSSHGTLNTFIEQYLKPFLDTTQPEWALRQSNNYVLPISPDVLNELIRANIVTNMFFPNQSNTSQIEFSLQKISLDPVVSRLQLSIGDHSLQDTQDSDSMTRFNWPQSNAKLVLNSIEGKHYELEEVGPWAFFKMLQKVNVLVDEDDPGSLQILFEVNGNSGRYLLKTQNEVNPFTPGILNGFALPDIIV